MHYQNTVYNEEAGTKTDNLSRSDIIASILEGNCYAPSMRY